LASKQTLGPEIGDRFPLIAKAATKSRLPLSAEGGYPDNADVSAGMAVPTPGGGRVEATASGPDPVSCQTITARGVCCWG
jgi:hypothetical protein